MNQELINEFVTTTQKMRKMMGRIYAANCDEKAATALQMQALRFLQENPESTVGKLAEDLMMSSGAIAQLIERLHINKLIIKETDDNDHRVTHLRLSTQGENQLTQMKSQFFEHMSSFLDMIPENDLKELIRIQKNLLSKLEEREKQNA